MCEYRTKEWEKISILLLLSNNGTNILVQGRLQQLLEGQEQQILGNLRSVLKS
jgi:hypothetical protein